MSRSMTRRVRGAIVLLPFALATLMGPAGCNGQYDDLGTVNLSTSKDRARARANDGAGPDAKAKGAPARKPTR